MTTETPGQPSQPEDASGDGPVTLEDRTEPSGQGSPDTNQGKTEPMAPDTEHPEPLAVPSLADMNVGGADPQAPPPPGRARQRPVGDRLVRPRARRPAAHGDGRGHGRTPTRTRSARRSIRRRRTGRAPGPEVPVSGTSGTSHRAPGLQGETPDGEAVESDVQGGAARLGPQALDSRDAVSPGQGDDHGVPSSGTSATPGTSEEHRIVSGVRLPEAEES